MNTELRKKSERNIGSLCFSLLHTSYFILHLEKVLQFSLPFLSAVSCSRSALPSRIFRLEKFPYPLPAENPHMRFSTRIPALSAHCIGTSMQCALNAGIRVEKRI